MIRASGAVIGDAEKAAMHSAVDSGWLTAGPINLEFEHRLSEFTGAKFVSTCNSGSSANLLAVSAMVSSGLWAPGDEIITLAAGFPTTVNPLLMHGLVPVFVDVHLPTYNVLTEAVEAALTPRTRGAIFAHTLGNPADLVALFKLLEGKDVAVVEDCCDALGSTHLGHHVGTVLGRIATCSFFPAHHITTGEGGAVFTADASLARQVESICSWGRDCYCGPGQNNTCGRRFCQQFGDLPAGYDHKYVFTHLGFNLKLTEISAACGVAQMDRLPGFIAARRENFALMCEALAGLEDRLLLPVECPDGEASWFGFPLTLREEGLRNPLQQFLSERGVDSRLIFGGNLTKQPYMRGRTFRVAGSLENTDKVMNDSLWLGLWPGLSQDQVVRQCELVRQFLGEF